jgi:polysaccharide chain length determinant protein (PEP-CTERM system associated)
MQDIQKSLDLTLDFVRGIWIKKRFIIISSWLFCPIGFIYVTLLPDVYESEAVVYVDTRSLLQPLLQGLAVQTNPDNEIQMIATTLLSRSNIETIAREADLDITVTDEVEYNQLISEISNDIDLGKTGKQNIYTISYSHNNPVSARNVVQEALNLFVEGSLGNNRIETNNATRFLDEQISDYETRLIEAEQRLADFKRRYSDILPVQGTFYQNLSVLETQLGETGLQKRELEQQIQSIKEQLSGSTLASDNFSVRQAGEVSLTTRYDERIRGLEEKLDQLRLRYTEQHPDVIETNALLENLESLRKQEIETYLSSGGSTDSSLNSMSEAAQQFTLQISQLEGEFASLTVREQEINRKINDLRSKIDLVPQIEAENTSLNRDYDILKSNYEELLNRKEAAAISRRADVSSEDLQFRIIEPPLVPNEPSGPLRLVFYTLVLLLGFGIGIGIAFLVSQIKPILVRAEQLKTMTGLPILGKVTHLNYAQMKKRQNFRIIVFSISSGVILSIYIALITIELLNVDIVRMVTA